jgi:hypothetical protein
MAQADNRSFHINTERADNNLFGLKLSGVFKLTS